MAKVFNRDIKLGGDERKVGTPQVRVLEVDIDNNVLLATGKTLPTDADAGYARGCIFIKTDGGISTSVYVNVGSASSADFDLIQPTGKPVAVTAATVTITEAAHGNRTIVLDRAAGIAVTLPAASGAGTKYRFVVKTTFTASSTIKVANANDTMTGVALNAQDAADTAVMFETASDSDTITLNGTTTGGIKGDVIEIEDVATNLFAVRVIGSATGTEATPFSATV